MADFTAPSFSLGLDFDDEEEVDNGFDSDETLDPAQQEDEEPIPPPALKRLRRGPPPPASPASGFHDIDDDIEDFSSEEEKRWRPDLSGSVKSHGICSSSKLSLRGRGINSTQSANKSQAPKITPTSLPSSVVTFEPSTSKRLYPSLTSPVRKIHLVDSDSDDPSPNKRRSEDKKEVDASKKQTQYTQKEDLWKDFVPKEITSVATPALDEFCEEYFTSAKFQKTGHSKEKSTAIVYDLDELEDHSSKPQPPSYKYFYHDDANIRRLIRERLPFFVPIKEVNGNGNQDLQAEDLDYMGQFEPTNPSSQVQKSTVRSSKARGKKSTTSVNKTSDATGSWVNPRSTGSIPKDAGKRRVSAVGGGSGSWFTNENGRKVYMSKDGRELTGRIAYTQYKKDNGGFGKGKKKATAKRKKK